MRIREIEICSNDIAGTKMFYEGILKLKIRHKDETRISFYAGESTFTFIKTDLIERPVYHFAFNIPQNQIPECLEWLEQRVEILPVEGRKVADFSNWNAHSIYSYDNNRNVMEWIARHDINNDSQKPFTGRSIECISEIGLVTDHVPAYASKLSSQYNIPVFSKQPPREKFTVLGDDYGLLILSASGRNWFPTNIPANELPTKVLIESESGITELIMNHG